MLNTVIFETSESQNARSNVRSIAGLNDETGRLRSGFVVQPRAAALKNVRGCVSVTHKRATATTTSLRPGSKAHTCHGKRVVDVASHKVSAGTVVVCVFSQRLFSGRFPVPPLRFMLALLSHQLTVRLGH